MNTKAPTDESEDEDVETTVKNVAAFINAEIQSALLNVINRASKERSLDTVKKFLAVVQFLGLCHIDGEIKKAVLILCDEDNKDTAVLSMAGFNISEEEAQAVISIVSGSIDSMHAAQKSAAVH